MIPYATRRDAVLTWFDQFPGQSKWQERVDVLNKDFVDWYLEKTGAKFAEMPYGAHRCSSLRRTLRQMHKEGLLDRSSADVQGVAGMGFPTWVWSYRLVNQPLT